LLNGAFNFAKKKQQLLTYQLRSPGDSGLNRERTFSLIATRHSVKPGSGVSHSPLVWGCSQVFCGVVSYTSEPGDVNK